jgi:hypothetical protein
MIFLMTSVTHAQVDRTLSVIHLQNGPSYFQVSISDEGTLSGSWPGWCAHWATLIDEDIMYNAKFYSSYAQNLPVDLVDRTENLDEMNWVLNQRFIGRSSSTGHGVYTSGDVQVAIWTLLDNFFETSTVSNFSLQRVDEIVAMAIKDGKGFYPSCKQVVGMLLAPTIPTTGQRGQTTVIEVPREHFPKCSIPSGD